MGTSVTWHVVSVPTSPGTSRHPPRPIRLAPVFRFCLWLRCPLSTISPFSALFTRAGTDGGDSASSNPEPNSPTIRRKFHRSHTRTPTLPAKLTTGAADFRGEQGLIVRWLTLGCSIEVCAIGCYYRLQLDRDQCRSILIQ